MPSAHSFFSAALKSVTSVLPLRNVNAFFAGVIGGRRDAQLHAGILLLVVEEGQFVVDGGVDASLLQQRDRLRPAFDSFDVGTVLLRQGVPVAGVRLRRLLALQVGEALDVGVIRPGDDARRGTPCTAR